MDWAEFDARIDEWEVFAAEGDPTPLHVYLGVDCDELGELFAARARAGL